MGRRRRPKAVPDRSPSLHRNQRTGVDHWRDRNLKFHEDVHALFDYSGDRQRGRARSWLAEGYPPSQGMTVRQTAC
jgi:hypothetical protein